MTQGKDENGNPVPSFDMYLAYDPKADLVQYRLTYREFEGDDVAEWSASGLIPAESFARVWEKLQGFAPKVVSWHETLRKIETAEAIKDVESFLNIDNIQARRSNEQL